MKRIAEAPNIFSEMFLDKASRVVVIVVLIAGVFTLIFAG